VDRGRRLGGEHFHQLAVGGFVRALPDVLRVLLGRVVVAEGRLDPALRLGRVARLKRALGHDTDAGAAALGGDGGSEPGGPAPDNEHVEGKPFGHDARIVA